MANGTSPDPAAAADGLQGRIDSVRFGPGFLVVEGWGMRAGGQAPTALELDVAGRRHTVKGLFARRDLAQQGISTAAIAFCADVSVERPLNPGDLVRLLLDGTPLISLSMSEARPRSFRPLGAIESAFIEEVSGWAFDPVLWQPGTPAPLVLAVGPWRIPIPLTAPRPELPFATARSGTPIGFRVDLREVIVRSQGAAAVEALFAESNPRLGLVSNGFQLADAELTAVRGAVSTAVAKGEAASPPPSARPRQRTGEPDGFIDYFCHALSLGGWLFAGWVRLAKGEAVAMAEQATVDGTLSGPAALLTYPRADVASLGLGLVGFIKGPASPPQTFESLSLGARDPRHLRRSEVARRVSEREALEAMRLLIQATPGAGATPFARAVRGPVYEGMDTLNPAAIPVFMEVDEVIPAPRKGAMLIGWLTDPRGLVKSIRLRAGEQRSQPLAERWITIERPDIAQAYGAKLGLTHARWGFEAFAEAPGLDLTQAFLEVQLVDGSITFKPVPAPIRSGRDAIVRALSGIRLGGERIVSDLEVLAPAVISIKQDQLAHRAAPRELVAGTPPERPRCSIIIPLYGRLDFMLYQMALFSEHDRGLDEIIYVLDDPPRAQECVELARSVYRRFGLPLRLVLLAENLGFAGASNAGLEAARGHYICFLNSDVMPSTPYWIDTLVAAMEEDPSLGLLGTRLLFEDGTVQHIGMELERKPLLGDMLFPIHPHKGRMPPPGTGVRRVPLVTGALSLMRRDIARECGGFDTSYVIGDFEDADLCMKVRARNLDCAVHDDVTLYHLERQSQGSAANDWRQNLTLVNAWTFTSRWQDTVGEVGGADAATQIG